MEFCEADRLMRTLDAESQAGEVIFDRLLGMPVSRWNEEVAQNPAWIRFGTFEFVIDEAQRLIDREPQKACAMTTFVLLHIPFMPIPRYAEVLARSLRAHSWITHGHALLELGVWAYAVAAGEIAKRESDGETALWSDNADALLLLARAHRHGGDVIKASELLEACGSMYREVGELASYAEVLIEFSFILAQADRHNAARIMFMHAHALLRTLGDPRGPELIAKAMSKCAPLCVDVEQPEYDALSLFPLA